MGRPVFHEYTLDELVAASRVVARVHRGEPRERTEDRGGLQAVLWPLQLVEVLCVNDEPVRKGGMSREDLVPSLHVPKDGEQVEVLINRVNLVDQANRQRSSSGASFPAQRYRSDVRTPEAAEWIAFLMERGGQYELTAQGAFVPVEELPAVRESIRVAESRRGQRRESREAMRAHLINAGSR